MRTVPESIASALAQGAAKLCHAWIVTRGDGERLGFTDHDRDVTVAGVVCHAASGWTAGAASQPLGLEASDGSVSGVLSAGALRAVDIQSGLYDGAQIEMFVVDWDAPMSVLSLSVGRLARLEARGGVADDARFVAHVEGPAAGLERVIGRRFTPLCDAVLGDARCGVGSVADGAVCDKRYATCLNEFDNILNFRGFPDVPGEDFLTVYPREGDVMDGGSRLSGAGRA